MATVNYAAREINIKIVYYGPALSGKTTNLQIIHKKSPDSAKSDMVSLATEADRTLFFDFLPIDLGKIKGFTTKIQLYTVPGQVYYNATRKLVLRGVDGIVFVADSDPEKMPENIESLNNMEENLREYGYDLSTIPVVIQFNKRDVPSALSREELSRQLNRYNTDVTEAVAREGKGVFETLKIIGKKVIDLLNAKYASPQQSSRPAPMQAQRRVEPQTTPTKPQPSRQAPKVVPSPAEEQQKQVAIQQQLELQKQIAQQQSMLEEQKRQMEEQKRLFEAQLAQIKQQVTQSQQSSPKRPPFEESLSPSVVQTKQTQKIPAISEEPRAQSSYDDIELDSFLDTPSSPPRKSEPVVEKPSPVSDSSYNDLELDSFIDDQPAIKQAPSDEKIGDIELDLSFGGDDSPFSDFEEENPSIQKKDEDAFLDSAFLDSEAPIKKEENKKSSIDPADETSTEPLDGQIFLTSVCEDDAVRKARKKPVNPKFKKKFLDNLFNKQ